VLLAAPNGFGKTAVGLAASLAASKGRVYWVARTLREAEHVRAHIPELAVVVKGRAELCPALPEPMSSEEAAAYCHAVKHRCRHYQAYLDGSEDKCPYYEQFQRALQARLIATTYQMLLKPSLLPQPRSSDVLVVDEAHNALAVTEELSFTQGTVERALSEARAINAPRTVVEFLEGLLTEGLERLEPSVRLSILAESLVYYGRQVRRRLAEQGLRPRSSLHRLGQCLRAVAAGAPFSAEEGYLTAVVVEEPRWPRCPKLFLSGTVSPADAKLLGAEYLDFTEHAPYKAHTIILDGLTTEFEWRSEEMYRRYAELLDRLSKRPSVAFAASYKILQ